MLELVARSESGLGTLNLKLVSGVRPVLWRILSLAYEVWADSEELGSEAVIHADMQLKLFKRKCPLKCFEREGEDLILLLRWKGKRRGGEKGSRYREGKSSQPAGKACVLHWVTPALGSPGFSLKYAEVRGFAV